MYYIYLCMFELIIWILISRINATCLQMVVVYMPAIADVMTFKTAMQQLNMELVSPITISFNYALYLNTDITAKTSWYVVLTVYYSTHIVYFVHK